MKAKLLTNRNASQPCLLLGKQGKQSSKRGGQKMGSELRNSISNMHIIHVEQDGLVRVLSGEVPLGKTLPAPYRPFILFVCEWRRIRQAFLQSPSDAGVTEQTCSFLKCELFVCRCTYIVNGGQVMYPFIHHSPANLYFRILFPTLNYSSVRVNWPMLIFSLLPVS